MLKNYFYSLLIILMSTPIQAMERIPAKKKQHLTYFSIQTGVGTVKDFKYNHDGSRIIVLGSNNNVAEVWDTETHQLVRKFVDTSPITAVNFHPISDSVITAHPYNIVKFWDFSSGAHLSSMKLDKCYNATNESLISYMCFHDLDSISCTLSNPKKVKFQANTNNQDASFAFEYKLKSNEQLDLLTSYNNHYIFLRLKNSITKNRSCKIFRINDNHVDELVDCLIYDYCYSTNNFLTSPNNKDLYEYPFAPDKEPQTSTLVPVYSGDSTIKSAIYNANGTEILISTENGMIFIVQRKKSTSKQWKLVSWLPLNLDIVSDPIDSCKFAAASFKDNTITLFNCRH